MHILFALIGMVGLFYFFYHHQLKRPALSAPISLFEREVTAREFDEMVLSTSTRIPVMVDFYDPWCGPCRDFAPILADIVRTYNGAFLLARISYDQSTELMKRYNITCVPTIALFRDGKRVDGFEGQHLPHQVRYFLAKNGINVFER